MKQAAENCPNIFAVEMEPLYRMVKKYDMEKREQDEKANLS
jgi:hypothetical protein